MMIKKISFFLTALFAFLGLSTANAAPWTIAIDPGHGGKDPGAISYNKQVYEKNVTLSIARELKALLDKDPNFNAVMTRTGDYYISVPERSEIARRKKANYLVSIHADSSLNPKLRGASVWVLSNRRANDEMGQWLEDHEKQSELLGGAGRVLAGHSNEQYLNQTVLDLQFGHSQRAGYELGNAILRNFAQITILSRNKPQHASLGVLRSPDIPSVLVETGFLSNAEEGAKLSSLSYRRRIAYVIYQGIVDYRKRNGGLDVRTKIAPPATHSSETKSSAENTSAAKNAVIKYTVKSGDRLDKIAKKFEVKQDDIVKLNKLKRKELLIGQILQIPDNGKNASEKTHTEKTQSAEKQSDKPTLKASGKVHTVKSGDRLHKIAQKYGVSEKDIQQLNGLKRKELRIGEKLKIPAKISEKEAKNTTSSQNSNNEKKSAVKNNEKNTKDKSTKSKEIPKYHLVEKGQTLYGIARLYGVAPSKLLKLNPKLKNGKVQTGQKIQIKE